jgi:hypothetical protein
LLSSCKKPRSWTVHTTGISYSVRAGAKNSFRRRCLILNLGRTRTCGARPKCHEKTRRDPKSKTPHGYSVLTMNGIPLRNWLNWEMSLLRNSPSDDFLPRITERKEYAQIVCAATVVETRARAGCGLRRRPITVSCLIGWHLPLLFREDRIAELRQGQAGARVITQISCKLALPYPSEYSGPQAQTLR